MFNGLFPRSVKHIATETNVLSKSSTLTRGMTVFARTADTYLHASLSGFNIQAGKSMLLNQDKDLQFLTSFYGSRRAQVLLFLDQIKREKGVW